MHIALQVFHTAQILDKAAKRVFTPHGLTVAQFNVLHLLSDQPAGMRASDLAKNLVVDPSNVTGLLKRMVKEDLVEDSENPRDGRQRIVTPTAKGRAVWKKAERDYEAALAMISAGLTPAEERVASEALRKLLEKAYALSA